MTTHRERLTPLIEEALAVADQIPDGPDLAIWVHDRGSTVSFWMPRTDTKASDAVMRSLVERWGTPDFRQSLSSAVWGAVPGVAVEAHGAERYFEPSAVPVPSFGIPEAVEA